MMRLSLKRYEGPMLGPFLSWEENRTPIKFLVDSGDTYSHINYRHAEILGIDLVESESYFTLGKEMK